MSNLPKKRIPYFKSNKLLWTWNLCDGENGCEIVHNEAVKLSMEQTPPTLRDQPPLPKKEKISVVKKEMVDPTVKLVEDIIKVMKMPARFKAWLDAPPPSEPPKATEPAVREKIKNVPPFDIQQIPDAMRNMSMPMSAKLMEKWFAGQLNYSRTANDEIAEINQDGAPYPPNMIDMATIKMEWVLQFGPAKKQFQELISTRIGSEKARETISRILSRYPKKHDLSAWRECNNDIQARHRLFQFQHVQVEGTMQQKFLQYLRDQTSLGGMPSDLTGSLGAFNMYAAIDSASFNRERNTATVTGISIYVRDPYSFFDEPGKGSQYLGHWNAKSMSMVPLHFLPFSAADGTDWVSYPITKGNMYDKGNVFYPIRNKDFREWQQKHQQGGDFMIYSDRKSIVLDNPITVKLS
ncbi:MAG: DUF6402 family protein [Aquirhabdus sp.]